MSARAPLSQGGPRAGEARGGVQRASAGPALLPNAPCPSEQFFVASQRLLPHAGGSAAVLLLLFLI